MGTKLMTKCMILQQSLAPVYICPIASYDSAWYLLRYHQDTFFTVSEKKEMISSIHFQFYPL